MLFILHRQSAQFNSYLLPGFVCIVGGLVFVYPPVFGRLLNKMLSMLKKEPLQATLDYKSILVLLGFYTGLWIYNGVTFYFFLNSLQSFPLSAIFDIVGILVTAGLLGFLAFFCSRRTRRSGRGNGVVVEYVCTDGSSNYVGGGTPDFCDCW